MRLAQITAFLLIIPFGSTAGILELRRIRVESLSQRLNAQGQYVFVQLVQFQAVSSFGTSRYFYPYRGSYAGRKFEITEEVSPGFYHLHSEGKSVQALLYRDDAGLLHAHLRGNPEPFGRNLDSIFWISLGMAAAGIVPLAVFLILWIKRRGVS